MVKNFSRVAAAFAFAGLIAAPALAQDKFIVVASTTSTQDSGLFGHILPIFKAKTGIDVRVVAQGTGQALATAKKGDADVVFVHDKVAEGKFVEEGFGVDRRSVLVRRPQTRGRVRVSMWSLRAYAQAGSARHGEVRYRRPLATAVRV